MLGKKLDINWEQSKFRSTTKGASGAVIIEACVV